MQQKILLLFIAVFFMSDISNVQAQLDQQHDLAPIFNQTIETPDVWRFEQLQYVLEKVPALPSASTGTQWTREAESLRRRLLENVIFHGWPKEVVEAKPIFEEVGTISSSKGYQIRKLRYEVVPGMWSTALLYEPKNLNGKMPAVMSLVGHYYGKGNAMSFNQKLCINYALRGMIAITPEWLDTGELNSPENSHPNFEPQLDFVGVNPVGLFYLEMRRVLDYLYLQPNVDQSRIGVTGLSGGGWQTIVLSSLDPRVYASIPVAGFESAHSFLDRISGPEWYEDIMGDTEQAPTDFFTVLDYSTLAAMRAPRPTLEIFNAEDDCCFRAPLVKPDVFDAVKSFFALYGKENLFQFHENRDPGTHNYELDNREQSYRFFDSHFSLSAADREIPVQAEIKTYNELEVGLPKDNLTFLGLARDLASRVSRPPIPQSSADRVAWSNSERIKLENVVRYKTVSMKHPWAVASTKNNGLESIAYRFQLSNNLSATGILVRAIPTARSAPIVVVLDDEGKQAAIAETNHGESVVSDLLERGNQVLVLDLLFTPLNSQARPPSAWRYTELLATFGDRPLGIEAAQLIEIAEWLQGFTGSERLSVLSYGKRDQVIALVASALRPQLFSKVDVRGGMRSLAYLLNAAITAPEAADLFCQDLYKEFDIDQLVMMAKPTQIYQEYLTVNGVAKGHS